MTLDERLDAIARLLIIGRERRRARLAAEAEQAVERGDACRLPWAAPKAAPPTEEELRRLPRYRPFKRRPRQEPAD